MLIDRKQGQLLLPDFFIVGAARSGTTSLCYYLREHREIYIPDEKEPEFFNFPGDMRLEQYSRLFSGAREGQRIGEASASYLYHHEKSIDSMLRVYGENSKALKMIAILRNPIERAWSYFMLLRRGGKDIEFFDVVKENENNRQLRPYHDFIKSGKYCAQLEAFKAAFPRIHLLLFEQLTGQTEMVLKQVYRYLELQDTDFVPSNVNLVYNRSGRPKSPVFRPLYDVLFQDRPMKTRFKHLLPLLFRQRVKTVLSSQIMRKERMPAPVGEYLFSVYEKEIRSLSKRVEPGVQKKIVLSWIGER